MDMQATATRITAGWQWTRMALVTAGVTLLVVAMPVLGGAEEKNDPSKAAEGQIIGCALAGGGAHVHTERTANGLTTDVTCIGGLLDGVGCTNDAKGTECDHPDIPSTGAGPLDTWDVPVAEIMGVLERGSKKQITKAVKVLLAQPPTGPLTVPAADEGLRAQHDAPGQHGHQGGKGRRK